MSRFDDQIAFNIESEAKNAAQDELEFGELSEELRSYVRKIGFGEEIAKRQQVETRLETVRGRKDKIRSQIRELQADLEDAEREETRLEEKQNQLTSLDDKYDATLEMLEGMLIDGQRVWEGHGQVKRAARIGGKEPGRVIEDLQDRNPEIPDHAFEDGLNSSKKWEGFSDGE